MFRQPITERPDLAAQADYFGFEFCNIDGEKYWDESAYYQFTLKQIENDLEDPTNELEQMCLELVDKVVRDEYWLKKFVLPERFWDLIATSWHNKEPSLYGRMDFSYHGTGPAKLLEYNADTPTSIYEAGFFQWLWLEQQVDRGVLPRRADQFNSIQEALINRFNHFSSQDAIHFAHSRDSIEDKGTVAYLQDCAYQAGMPTVRMTVEDIGIDAKGQLTDLEDTPITQLFKLYPWEELFLDEFGPQLLSSDTLFVEPSWKAVLSNKAILPLLWQMFPGHPNLLPSYFAGEEGDGLEQGYVSKPLFSREGENITWVHPSKGRVHQGGSYGGEGFITQALAPLPVFAGNHTLIGSWVVGHKSCGLTIREDNGPITKDTSRFVPHIILG
ncbi:glutathionylspermidine synthase family protein [Pseudoalteromonas sp. T1lg48]|uniref:glutathionylspermidine synthase family protein n=1 Tax=Pseudoalteromonas sp. T1lg48 TaxID=2077100 RepID=UPI000CF73114|nr:glutathionylspermidine synthase family protein [Pseudoalteromonas sp. T1lg48]